MEKLTAKVLYLHRRKKKKLQGIASFLFKFFSSFSVAFMQAFGFNVIVCVWLCVVMYEQRESLQNT